MGRRILLVSELGGGHGHRLTLDWVAAALRNRGHEAVVALPRPAHAPNSLQAPPWPGVQDKNQLRSGRRAGWSHADMLAAYGLAEPDAFRRLLAASDALFAQLKPDAIVADSAPATLAAARGRIPTVAVGNGFGLPPSGLKEFPNLHASASDIDEEPLLETVNDALAASSRSTLQALPELYQADRVCLGTFTELDPYAEWRRDAPNAPWLPEWEGGAQMRRQELFGYFSIASRKLEPVIGALGRLAFAGVPVTVYVPRPRPHIAELLASTKIRIETKPLTLSEIQSRARMIVSFGSLGLVSFALAAGIPQIVIPLSLDNRVTGRAIEELGTGRSLRIARDNPLEPALLAQILQQSYLDADLTARAVSRAPDFIRRVFPRTAEVAASMVEELL